MLRKLDILILAGGKSKTSLRRFTKQENKALIKIIPSGAPMIIRIINSLKKSRHIHKIVVAGSKAVNDLIKNIVDMTIPEGETILATLKSGIALLSPGDHFLISSCDIPLVTEKHIDYYIEECNRFPNFDFYYPIVEKETYQHSYPFPELKRVYAHLIEGSFTGGNIILINPQIILQFEEIINQFINFRKHPLKMARLLGPQITQKYLRKYLSIRDLEKKFSELFIGFKGKAIITPPEMALDIDKAMQLKKLREIMD